MIKILPPILANQIAAGEVVERPSSVVKELLENSLDAGADKVVVDIERGGHKLIRVKDNGKGVMKDELQLALSRHATSKISSLNDLEAIISLGFRGEALASISSVSRLTFTSKPADQEQAWQAQAEGRDMAVKLTPAAHPDGTTVEVVDLFFNTPARRKFLRTEKTEFSHIDETIRRIALSRTDAQFILTHNGKEVRRYNKAQSDIQKEKRIATICGRSFMENSLFISNENPHDNLKLYGWLGTPEFLRKQNDLQYFYVNGRMMRDKVINHAIRQAFADALDETLYPAFVLYLDMPADQVDVNVHPAKHEVRFHQTRLIHDFICQVLVSALREISSNMHLEGISAPVEQPTHDYQPRPLQVTETPLRTEATEYTPAVQDRPASFVNRPSSSYAGASSPRPTQQYQQQYRQYVQPLQSNTDETVEAESQYKVLTVIENQLAILEKSNQVYLLNVKALDGQLMADYFAGEVVSQPLLMPLSLALNEEQQGLANRQQPSLQSMGFHYLIHNQQLILRQVPAIFRQVDHANLIMALLEQPDTAKFLCEFALDHKEYDIIQVQRLIQQSSELTEDLLKPIATEQLLTWMQND